MAGLWALAVAQPVFDLLTRSPEFFVAHRADLLDVLLVAGAVALSSRRSQSAPLILVGCAARPPHRGRASRRQLCGALVAIIVLQLGYRLGLD